MWELKTIKEVCAIKPPKSEVRKKLKGDELVSFVPMNDLGECAKHFESHQERPLSEVSGSYTYFAENDVLLAKITPCFENGKLGIARNLKNGVGFGSSEFVVLRSKGSIDPEYLFYFLSQDIFRRDGAAVMTGAVGHRRVPKEFIEEHLIPTPPLPEQKRIVAILDEAFEGIDAAIANTQANLSGARELFESCVNQVLDAEKQSWEATTLGKHVDLLTGHAFKSKEYTNDKSGHKLLRCDNIMQGYFRWEAVKRWPAEKSAEFTKFLLKESDVILAMDRTWVKAGLKYAKVTADMLPCLLVQRVARMRARPSLDEDFLYHLIGSKKFTDYVLSIQTGLGVPHISGKQIQDFSFKIPPRSVQNELSSSFESIKQQLTKLDTIYLQKLNALHELKQSILAKAFRGELTQEEIAA